MEIILYNYNSARPNPVYGILADKLRLLGHGVLTAQYDGGSDIVWCNGRDETFKTPVGRGRQISWNHLRLPSKVAEFGPRLRTVQLVRDVFDALQPDIVQVNTAHFPWLIPFRASPQTRFLLDIRQINEMVRDSLYASLGDKRRGLSLQAQAKHVFDHTFFCHQAAATHILGTNWPRYASVVPVGVDEHFLRSDDNKLAWPEENQPLRFVYVGTLSRLRTLEKLILAAEMLQKTHLQFRLTLVGPDRTEGSLQQLVEKLNLEECVHIAPPVPYEDVPDLLTRHHVAVAYVPDRPTWHYQPTIKILEYRAMGMPILSTDVASHRGIVEDGVNGVMVKDSPASIAVGMRRFIEDRRFLQDCLINARSMRGGQSWLDVARMYEAVYVQKAQKPGNLTGNGQSR